MGIKGGVRPRFPPARVSAARRVAQRTQQGRKRMISMRVQIERLARVGRHHDVRCQAFDEAEAREFQEAREPLAAQSMAPPFLQRQRRIRCRNSSRFGGRQKTLGLEQAVKFRDHVGDWIRILQALDSIVELCQPGTGLPMRGGGFGTTSQNPTLALAHDIQRDRDDEINQHHWREDEQEKGPVSEPVTIAYNLAIGDHMSGRGER